jgi:peptidoglycan/LPS O-acetylase OafA/YrhL
MTTDTIAAEGRHRFQALDGLRGVAALLVVLLHVEWSNHLTDNRFVQHGYLAVDLFFILSGLVISSNYCDRIRDVRDARRFIGLRFFRLYPLHLAMLAAFMCLECAKIAAQHAFAIAPGPQAPFTGDDSLGAAVANLFLVNGLHVLDRPSWNGASWSISCEFAAYLVFCIAVLTGIARSRLFFIGGFLMAAAGYTGLALERGTLNVTADWGIIRCLSGFFLGMLIFRLRGMNVLRQSRTVIGGCGIAVMIAVILTMSFASGPLLVFAIPLFAFAITLLQFDQGPVARLLISPAAQFLGRISYSIYMVHSFVVVCLLIILKRIFIVPSAMYSMRENPILMMNPWIGDLLVLGTVALVIAGASATYALIEEPGRLIGRRLFSNSKDRSLARVLPGTTRVIPEEHVQGIRAESMTLFKSPSSD